MITDIRALEEGKGLNAKVWEALRRLESRLDRAQLQSSPTVRVRQSPSGVTLEVIGGGQSSTSTSSTNQTVWA